MAEAFSLAALMIATPNKDVVNIDFPTAVAPMNECLRLR